MASDWLLPVLLALEILLTTRVVELLKQPTNSAAPRTDANGLCQNWAEIKHGNRQLLNRRTTSTRQKSRGVIFMYDTHCDEIDKNVWILMMWSMWFFLGYLFLTIFLKLSNHQVLGVPSPCKEYWTKCLIFLHRDHASTLLQHHIQYNIVEVLILL